MLTKELAIAEYDFQRGRIIPDRLKQRTHQQYGKYADEMVNIYWRGVGQTRRQLHRQVHDVFADEDGCPTRRIDAFCKLLDDAGVYLRDRRGKAAELRRRVFQLAASHHPLVSRRDQLFEKEEAVVKQDIAEKLGKPWQEIEQDLFADVMEFHRLKAFDGFSGGSELLARYNVAQVQAALYGAVSMTVWAATDFKMILRYAKLARLMHTIERDGQDRYRLRFDGPASVLRQTRRYGAAMARFLPALIAFRGWRLHAAVQARHGNWMLSLDLSADDGLNSPLPAPEEFDSELERAFAEKWGPDRRDGWRLERESEILHHGQKAFIPDFVFHHQDGRRVFLEIVGFWTPEYVQAKIDTLRQYRNHSILLAIGEGLGDGSPEFELAIRFKTRLKISDVLERLAM